MFVTTSQIPIAWLWVVGVVWTIVGTYLSLKGNWFDIPDRLKSFPFSARQFFLVGLSLVCVAGLYLASFLIAHNVAEALKQLPFSATSGLLTRNQWFGFEQIVGIILTSLGLVFFTSLVPDDLKSLVVGSSGNWRKVARGVVAGLLVYPIVVVTSFLVGSVVGMFSHEPKPPQVAIDILQSLSSSRGLFGLTLIVMTTIVPYVEEMLFRGYLQSFLLGILHPTLGIMASSVAFAALHYSEAQQGSNYEILAGLFVFSIFSSRIRLKEDSIFSSIGMHISFNTTSVILYISQQ